MFTLSYLVLCFAFKVVANDSDSFTNAAVTYSLVPDVNDHYLSFNINPANGSIATAYQLDREKSSEYLLTVKAEDGASKDQRRFVTLHNFESFNEGL